MKSCGQEEELEQEVWLWGYVFINQSISQGLPYQKFSSTLYAKEKKFVPSLAGVVFLHIDHVQN